MWETSQTTKTPATKAAGTRYGMIQSDWLGCIERPIVEKLAIDVDRWPGIVADSGLSNKESSRRLAPSREPSGMTNRLRRSAMQNAIVHHRAGRTQGRSAFCCAARLRKGHAKTAFSLEKPQLEPNIRNILSTCSSLYTCRCEPATNLEWKSAASRPPCLARANEHSASSEGATGGEGWSLPSGFSASRVARDFHGWAGVGGK